jgi:hypothetical protein
MTHNIMPILGPDLWQVGQMYWNLNPNSSNQTVIAPALARKTFGDDGGEYWFVQAGEGLTGTATTGTQVSVTFATKTAVAGTGGYYTPPNTPVLSGQAVWVRRGAWNANPT